MQATPTTTIRSIATRPVSTRSAARPTSPPLFFPIVIRSLPTRSSLISPSSAPARRSFGALATSSSRRNGSDFSRPAPPALPPHLQREFDELVRRAQTPAAPGIKLDSELEVEAQQGGGAQADKHKADPEQEMHPDLRRKPKPEFQGERNPLTGEVGGPKIEPLKHGDWQYGGRATDF
ncbi:hypothetical protein BMF94_3454 [Rhodotorula taiwanensis]|uniref:Succinate dehydrogenase assembly factor 4, mitochondrial n=1 Tax=Rhodotorula taiwanensis TaxID=741276 RepID=A0A2S5B9R7_9BASI|nr:hypothetical protein BMF94_3454 [Rhodotorula taiwanensis]